MAPFYHASVQYGTSRITGGLAHPTAEGGQGGGRGSVDGAVLSRFGAVRSVDGLAHSAAWGRLARQARQHGCRTPHWRHADGTALPRFGAARSVDGLAHSAAWGRAGRQARQRGWHRSTALRCGTVRRGLPVGWRTPPLGGGQGGGRGSGALSSTLRDTHISSLCVDNFQAGACLRRLMKERPVTLAHSRRAM
jgi:hypothetical protein